MLKIGSMRKEVDTIKIRSKRLMLKAGFIVSFIVQIWAIGLNLSVQIEWGGLVFVTLTPYVAQAIALIMSVIGYRMVNVALPMPDRLVLT